MYIFITLFALLQLSQETCPRLKPQENFDLEKYASKRWFVQMQAETRYLPKTWNFCEYADYQKLEKKTFWNYDIQVHNVAFEKDGTTHDSKTFICAKTTGEAGKLMVGPCFLPSWRGWTSGDYWVVYNNEEEGLAVITGGQPEIETDKGCIFNKKVNNNSGLWIFTREQQAPKELVQKGIDFIQSQGIDAGILNTIDQSKC